LFPFIILLYIIINEEQKKLKRNENKRKLRAKISAETPSIINKPELVVNIDTYPLPYKPKKAKKFVLKEKTIITYTSKLRAFHLRMTGLPLSQDIIDAIKGNDYDKKLYNKNLNIFMIKSLTLKKMNLTLSLTFVKYLLKLLASLSSLKYSSLLREILKMLKALEETKLSLTKMILSALISKIFLNEPLNLPIITKNYFIFL